MPLFAFMISFVLSLLVSSILGLLMTPPARSLIHTTIPAENSSDNDTARLLLPGVVSCLGRPYGYDLSLDSCINAYMKMPRTLAPTAYSARSEHSEPSYPVRYQSDDGLCVIDLQSRQGHSVARGDVTRGVDISDAARSIIEKCMMHPTRPKSGGSLYGFSMCSSNGHLF